MKYLFFTVVTGFGIIQAAHASDIGLIATPTANNSVLTDLETVPIEKPSAELLQHPEKRATYLKQLRSRGYQGIAAFRKAFSTELAETHPSEGTLAALVHQSFDTLCAQRDCRFSNLFWHTDLEQAKKTAQREQKPILSLHLLGKLTDELSCANSRYFRALLYTDPHIAELLRSSYVLHWKTVREVPQVEITFENGKTLRNTVTGNSAHFILDWHGRPVDVLPGLYHPEAFLDELQKAQPLAAQSGTLNAEGRDAFLTQYHRAQLDNLDQQWLNLAKRYRALAANSRHPLPEFPDTPPSEPRIEQEGPDGFPTAMEASFQAMSKAMVERPVVSKGLSAYRMLRLAQEEVLWHELAAMTVGSAHFSEETQRFLELQLRLDHIESAALLKDLQRAVSVDTVRNRFKLHRVIHQWFLENPRQQIEPLNKRLYARLFLTPEEDPWVGLSPLSSYSGLPNNGLSEQLGPYIAKQARSRGLLHREMILSIP